MRKIDYCISIGFANANRRGTVEVEDEATNEEIDKAVNDEVTNWLQVDWSERDT